MTEAEKQKLLAGFEKSEQDAEDPWTEERLIAAAKRIIKKLRIEGKLQ